ncbi:MAG: B12-binding domain-containing radical SAM protein [Actinomycetota bacterium]
MKKENRKKKVLLINPNLMKPPVAPLGLEYIGSYLMQNSIDTHLLDLAWEDEPLKAIGDKINANRYDLIGISVRNTDDSSFATRDFVLKQTKKMVGEAKKADAPVVLGGCGFSIMPEAVLKYCRADFGIAGDGEEALLKLLDSLCSQKDCRSIPGLLYRQGPEIAGNPPAFGGNAVPIKLSRGFVRNRRYFAEGGQAGIETKRGCSRSCIYCADPLAKGKSVRFRDMEDIMDEIALLVEKGIYCFHLCDSEFNISSSQASEFCRQLIKSKINKKISWYTYAMPKPFPDSLAGLMKEAGCSGINFGADSASPEVLGTLGRDFGPRDIASAADACRKHGIACMIDLLLGGPGETPDTVAQTIKFARSLPVTAVGVNTGIRIYPGTIMAEMVKEEGFMPQNANLYGKIEQNTDFLEPVFYLSANLGAGMEEKISKLTAGDRRFMFMSKSKKSYNYNQNMLLTKAIRKGRRGAYWHILEQVSSRE